MEYKVTSVAYTWHCDECKFAGNGPDINDAQNHVNSRQHVVVVACTNTYKVIP